MNKTSLLDTRRERQSQPTSAGFKHAHADGTVHTAVGNVYKCGKVVETLGSLSAHSEMCSYSVNIVPRLSKKTPLLKLAKLMSEFEERGWKEQK